MDPITENLIEGILITPLEQIMDERGGVFHIIKASSTGFHGFGEAYISKINEGKIKAWKFHREMTQNFIVPFGKMKLVLFDNRDSSKSKGVINVIYLDDNNNYKRVTIPPEIWYGFECQSSDFCLLMNVSNLEHNPNESISIPYIENKIIPYSW